MNADILFYALAALAAFTVGLSKGGLPMVGVLGVPLLALVISPVAAAALLLPIFIVSDVFAVWVYRHAYDRRNLMILIPATVLGIAIGWATASITSERLVTFLVGVIALAYCVNALIQRGNMPAKPADVPRGIFWGTIAGFTSFVSHSGAPPYQMYALPQKMPKLVFAGTSTIRTSVASTKIAVASPMPTTLPTASSPSTKARNTEIMMSAAAVMTRAVAAKPSATAVALSLVRTYSSRTRESRNTS